MGVRDKEIWYKSRHSFGYPDVRSTFIEAWTTQIHATGYKAFWLPQQKYFDRALSTDRAIRSHRIKLYPCRIGFPGRFAGSLLDMPD